MVDDGVMLIPRTRAIKDAVRVATEAVVMAIEKGEVDAMAANMLETSISMLMDGIDWISIFHELDDLPEVIKSAAIGMAKRNLCIATREATAAVIALIKMERVVFEHRDLLIKMMRDHVADDDDTEFIMAGAENLVTSAVLGTAISKYTDDPKVVKAFARLDKKIKGLATSLERARGVRSHAKSDR